MVVGSLSWADSMPGSTDIVVSSPSAGLPRVGQDMPLLCERHDFRRFVINSETGPFMLIQPKRSFESSPPIAPSRQVSFSPPEANDWARGNLTAAKRGRNENPNKMIHSPCSLFHATLCWP